MHSVLFVAAAAALGGAGWRLAGACSLRGLGRALGAAALGAGLATGQALLLGFADLATPLPLALAAAATWLVVARSVRWRGPTPAGAVAQWWHGTDRVMRLSAGGFGGVWIGWVAWQVQHPNLGFDGLIYHASIAGIWAQEGSTGSVLDIAHGLPVGNYPLANEAGLAWALALSDSLELASLWSPLLWLVLWGALVAGLGALAVRRGHAVLAALAVTTLPLTVTQLRGPYSDLAATAWLAACLALCAIAARGGGARALAPALVAGGLATGAKTTAALFALAGLAWALWTLRPVALKPLAAPAALAALLAGLWPVRNLIEHGAPLWPLLSNPGGDAIPPAFRLVDERFLDHGADLVREHADAYHDVLGGGVWLLAAALVLPLALRRRDALIGAGAVLAGIALWVQAPYTGIPREDLAVGATRYLLPTLVLAAATLALTRSQVGAGVLGAACAISLVTIADTFGGYPDTPAAGSLIVSAALGAGLAWFVSRHPRALPGAPRIRWVAVWLGTALWLTSTGSNYVARHQVALDSTKETAISVSGLLVGDPRFDPGSQPVAMFPLTLAILAGDRLDHRLSRIPDGESCTQIRARAEAGWVIVRAQPGSPSARMISCMSGHEPRGHGSGWLVWGPSI